MTSSLTKLPPELEVALAALVLVAAVFDARLKRIPNWLCATGLVLGLVLNFRFMQFAGLRQAGLGVALGASDSLAKVEDDAMHAVKGLYRDSSGAFTRRRRRSRLSRGPTASAIPGKASLE